MAFFNIGQLFEITNFDIYARNDKHEMFKEDSRFKI